MDSKHVRTQVVSEIRKLLPDVDQFSVDQADFTTDLGMDSIHLIDLVTNLERSLGVSISNDDVDQLHCVTDVVNTITGLPAAA